MSFRAAVLSVLLPLAAVPAAARDGGSLSIELVAPATILLSGPIDERSSQRLEEVVAGREVGAALVMLDSPGGLLVEGMALGRTIRRLGYSTAVPRGGVCHSACVFALLGGVYRFAAPQSNIGVHRFSSSTPGVDADAAQVISAVVVNYIREMGADVDLFERMTRRGSAELLLLGEKELRQLRVVNDGRLRARWAVHVQSGTLVLRGAQQTSQGESEVRLSCQDDQVLFEPLFDAGERAQELAASARRHLMRLGEGFMALAEPLQPLSARDGMLSATFALGPGQLKRLGGSEAVGYAVQSSAASGGFAIDTAGGGVETIREFLAGCASR